MKGSKKKWIALGCAVVVIGLAMWTYPFWGILFFYAKESVAQKGEYKPESCISNLKQVSQALQLYLQANDAYPPAERWMDELILYMHADNIKDSTQKRKFACPAVGDGAKTFGYAFNGQLGTLWSDEVSDPSGTAAVYDSTKLSWNAHDAVPQESLPKPPRHGGNNTLYADGHVSSEARR